MSRHSSWCGAVVLASLAATGVSAQDEDAPSDASGAPDLPLEAGRTLSITTDEGSWLSLDVSPDGRTVVFDLLGDLYLLPFGGGTARALTKGMAYDSQPRFSPDGSHVVFVSDRDGAENLWVVDVASRETDQITEGKTSSYESPEWLPDGRYIVASKATGTSGSSRIPKLWVWHVDGGAGIQLIDEPDTLRTSGAAPTPDGRHIWFAQRTGLWQYNAILPQYQLAVYDRDSGERYIRSARYGSAFRPTISPTGAGWSTARATSTRRGCGSGSSTPARSAGWPIRCSETTRSRWRAATCCRGCPSRPIRPSSWPPTAAGSGVSR